MAHLRESLDCGSIFASTRLSIRTGGDADVDAEGDGHGAAVVLHHRVWRKGTHEESAGIQVQFLVHVPQSILDHYLGRSAGSVYRAAAPDLGEERDLLRHL